MKHSSQKGALSILQTKRARQTDDRRAKSEEEVAGVKVGQGVVMAAVVLHTGPGEKDSRNRRTYLPVEDETVTSVVHGN